MTTEERVYRVITLGSFGVGKTSILMKASNPADDISMNYLCTIGVDYKLKQLRFKGRDYKFRIWDTAGQERFMNVVKLYYKDAEAVILVYDVTNLESFHALQKFVQDFRSCSTTESAFVLVGNKTDASARQVDESLALSWADTLEIPWIECSALTGDNINRIFELLLEQLVQIKSLPRSSSFLVSMIKPKRRCKC